MENTLENKAKFFAQYWGQQILFYPDNAFKMMFEIDEDNITDDIQHSSLSLRGLNQITDDEAIEVAKIFGYDLYSYKIVRSSTGIEIDNTNDELFNIFWSGTIWYKVEYEIDVQSNCIDYLRSKGFLLPFHDLSIEQIIAYGWAKLKTT